MRPRPPKTRLTPDGVRAILVDLEKTSDSQAEIAKRHGVSRSAIHFILLGYSWADVWQEWDGGRDRLKWRRQK